MKNHMIWISIEGTDEGKIYNSEDIDPIAIWLGRFINNGVEDEAYVLHYRREACEVYELAHRVPEWAQTAKESPFYKYTEAYQVEQERKARREEID